MLCYSQIQHAAGEASGVSFVLALMQEPIAVPPPSGLFLVDLCDFPSIFLSPLQTRILCLPSSFLYSSRARTTDLFNTHTFSSLSQHVCT